jgi:hypothetical protein
MSALLSGADINWQVIPGGGAMRGHTDHFQLDGSAGQSATGAGVAINFQTLHGFWQFFGIRLCDCSPGDANNDGVLNVADVVYEINFIFKGGPPPDPYATCSGDVNCDCVENIGDAVYKINYVFKGGPPPCTCEDWLASCGPPLR